MTKHNITNERGNIPVELPLREYVIKTLTFDIIFNEGRNEFKLDVEQDVIPRCSICSCTLGSFNSIREAIQYWNDRGNRNG